MIKVNFKLIDKILCLNWNECINFEIYDNDTLLFINNFINCFYDKVYDGLLEHPHNTKLREKNFNDLLLLVSNDKSILYKNILNCINDIGNKNNTEIILINNIFKLQACKNVKW